MNNLTHTKLKNIAIIAHVDHGKTTLMDGLLRCSGALDERKAPTERVMDSGDLEKERGITISAKNCSINWKEYKINLLDTPGHADFGGEVERSLSMVDGALLLVDAAEGPLPQTRFVLQKALSQKIKIGVVINKVDRSDQRVEEVRHEIEDLFLELVSVLDAHGEHVDFDLDLPFYLACAKQNWADHYPSNGVFNLDQLKKENLDVLLDFFISDYFPNPKIQEGKNLQLLISNLSYSPYFGALVIGRIFRGSVFKHQTFTLCSINEQENATKKNFRVNTVQIFSGLEQEQVESAQAGEIVILSGIEEGRIGDTLCSTEDPTPLPRLIVEPPTVSVQVSVNTSPMSGKEGDYLTSRKLEEYLLHACRHNVALQFEPTEDPKVFTLKGRGELQLGICFEELRRKGFEFMVSRPKVLLKTDENGQTLEPYELVSMDMPTSCTGGITEILSLRKGRMEKMLTLGHDRSRLEFVIPSRGLIGLRSTFLTETKGEGIISSQFLDYRPFSGNMLSRKTGALISDRAGKTTPYALFNLLSRGKQFIKPGALVYEGMVIGENTQENDINVNAVREKHLSSVRTAGKDENIILPPIKEMDLDFALGWIDNDEWVEVTPKTIRLRKQVLEQNKRSVIRK